MSIAQRLEYSSLKTLYDYKENKIAHRKSHKESNELHVNYQVMSAMNGLEICFAFL